MRKVLLVEPVIIIYTFAYFLTVPLIQQYIYRRLWEEGSNSSLIENNNTYCELNKSNPAYIKQKEVQEKASLFLMQLDLTGAVPSILVAIVLVADGDRHGRKKSLVLPSVGAFISNVFLGALSYFSLSLSILFAVAFFGSLFGSIATFLGGAFAFIADLCNEEKQKTIRIALVDLIFGLVSGLAGLTSGYFIRGLGFPWTFVVASLLHFINIFYITFCLEDTVRAPEFQQHASLSCSEGLKETFSGVYMLFKTSTCKKRTLIIVLLFTFMTYFFTWMGGSSLFTLYELDEPLCWNEVYIGYGAAAFTSVSVTSFLGVYLFSHCLRDIYIVFIGIFSWIGGMVMAAFAKTTLLMFLVRVPSLLCFMPIPVLRSMLSKVVLASEQGAVFACIACLEVMTSAISLAVFNSLYAATVAWFPGFSFLLSAGLCIIPLSVMCWLMCTSWHEEDLASPAYEEVSSEESIDS
ncbi:solute carrier family 46 member 3 isoform X1 [Mauremys reevesii]|uniref:solute carrier family 46 member 3 isoform X1 n=1 Tax=Mauremys reevesii TaxID=260615 RepID=UPI00193FEC34|nr:solute carrier family 46 member 3 isoform X1 [Mauremys reevesii]XP_039376817.1 solute carrier family 46 member 3 isoform X1 [Mauremys reevesii]